MNRRTFLAALAAFPCAASAQDGWTTYVNDRFGTRVAYPADRFTPNPPPANGDGRSFTSHDKTAGFRVWGMYNALERTIDQLRAEDAAQADEITYSTGGNTWYVLSGFDRGRVFYSRRLLRGDVIHALDIEYDKAASGWMDDVVARMSESFGAV